MKKLKFSKDITASLKNSWVFVDTTSLIAAINYKIEFIPFFNSLQLEGVSFITLPSVFFEFTRGSSKREAYNQRSEFLSSICTIYPIERHLEKMEEEILVTQKFCSNASYTDFLLVMSMIKFSSAYLLTENHKDMLLEILDRKHILTIDTGNQIRNHAFYQLSKTRFEKQIDKVHK